LMIVLRTSGVGLRRLTCVRMLTSEADTMGGINKHKQMLLLTIF